MTTPTRAFEFGYPPQTRSVGVHFKPWGLAPFVIQSNRVLHLRYRVRR